MKDYRCFLQERATDFTALRKWVNLTLLAILIAGCGDGEREPSIMDLDGVWTGSLKLNENINTCGFRTDPLNEIHEISIDGDDVTLISTDGRVLEGEATSSNSFRVEISDGASFPMGDVITYTNILEGSASVNVKHYFSRPGGCRTDWEGTMIRD